MNPIGLAAIFAIGAVIGFLIEARRSPALGRRRFSAMTIGILLAIGPCVAAYTGGMQAWAFSF